MSNKTEMPERIWIETTWKGEGEVEPSYALLLAAIIAVEKRGLPQ